MKNVKSAIRALELGTTEASPSSPENTESRDEDDSFSERGIKRAKRAKYASKACGQCKRRKIKCDGNVPCRACVAKARDCQQNGTDMRGRWRKPHVSSTYLRGPSQTSQLNQNAPRLTNSGIIGPNGQRNDDESSIGAQSFPDNSVRSGKKPRRNRTSPPQMPTFSGETSIAHNLTVVEGRLEQMGVRYARLRSASPNHHFSSHLTPSPRASPSRTGSYQEGSYIYQVLASNSIVPDRVQWDQLMQTFCDEVHILVPFLHLPSLWEAYINMWENFLAPRSNGYSRNGTWRFSFAHVLLCLANGRCAESSRVDGQDGQYSAGWSLYKTARHVFGDLLDASIECTDQLLLLQTILLMVVYLFRLDAHGPAEKLLALSISHSHQIGLQRRRVVEAMNPFEGEMSQRLWWCIYLMDRRLAIETGHPFLIQDVNIDIGLPQIVSDEWLSKHRGGFQPTRVQDTATEKSSTTVPYLVAMASYSKVVGKVWEALYGAATSESTPSPLLKEYLELLITKSQKDLQPEFSYDPRCPGKYRAKGLAWSQIKQQLIMRIRWSSLYLLIRKPMLQRAGSSLLPAPEAVENEVTCMRLSQSIIEDFRNVPEDHPKYTFPFLHYLTNATITALGLIIKQQLFKQKYGKLTLEAARSLLSHCRKTWVSGKLARVVWKLAQMAEAALNSSSPSDNIESTNHELSSLRSSYPAQTSPETFDLSQAHPPLSEQPLSTMESGLTDSHDEMTLSASYSKNTHLQRGSSGLPGGPTQSIDQNPARMETLGLPGHDDLVTNEFDFEEEHTVAHLPGRHQPRGPRHNELDSRRETGILQRIRRAEINQLASENSDSNGYKSLPATLSTSYTGEVDMLAPDPNVWLPGEMIDGGIEWLQTLFENDLDMQIPPNWN